MWESVWESEGEREREKNSPLFLSCSVVNIGYSWYLASVTFIITEDTKEDHLSSLFDYFSFLIVSNFLTFSCPTNFLFSKWTYLTINTTFFFITKFTITKLYYYFHELHSFYNNYYIIIFSLFSYFVKSISTATEENDSKKYI